MRILHILASFSPATGGPPEVIKELVKAHLEINDEVEVLCLDKPESHFLKSIRCPVHALGQSYLGAYAFSPKLCFWLHRNSRRFDAIVMHGIWIFPGIAVHFTARRAKRPYGIFVHGALAPWFDRQYPMKHLKKKLYWPIQYPVLRDAAAVLFTAESERDLAPTGYRPNKWNSVVVSLGVTDPNKAPADSANQIETFYRQFPTLRNRSYLIFLARLRPIKGCDLLVEAFSRLASQYPDVDLVMAGPDQDGMQAKLQEIAEDLGIAGRIHWTGMIADDLKWGALRACSALILPSHSENFGMSVVECLAVGRPVLISREVNIWSEIQSDHAGIVDEDTLIGVERMLQRWLSMNLDEQNAMAHCARLSFEQRFRMSRAAEALDRTFSGAYAAK